MHADKKTELFYCTHYNSNDDDDDDNKKTRGEKKEMRDL